ncbi:hypothetical protein GCM10023213_23040 [Prosthecobacter algae]|uniref:Low molecular weight protein antigen 6 PH domain-containing protein n=1 Tax=Prosthecobacter algae TaxID=1144682 RepID=A0ABP9P7H2_9BACT
MKTKFSHSPLIHLLALGLTVFFGWMAYRSSVDHFVRGGFPLRVVMVGGCGLLSLLVLGLYLRSGINRFVVEEDGLRIRRLGHSTFHPWSEIRRIQLNQPLHYLVIHGPDRALAFTSTDYFPRIMDFVRAIHQRSRCELSPLLAETLASQPMRTETQIVMASPDISR